MTSGMYTPRPHPEMRSTQHYTLRPQNRDQPEVRLSWKSFSSMRMSKIRDFDAILASSPGTFDL